MTGFAATGWRYGDGTSATEQQRRHREKQGRRKGEERRRRELYRAARKQEETTQQPSRASAKLKMATGTTGSRRKVITELPLDLNHKLLPNFYGNSKISKNKSCFKSKVVQLCFNNHTQIMSTF